ALAGAVVITPLVIIVRLPQALVPPPESDLAAVEAYRGQLRQRLSNNPHLNDSPIDLSSETGLQAAIQQLDMRADQLTKQAASTTFVSTAISQNGRLDALMVLATQTRLVWQIAQLYQQRPHWRELLNLYSNVAVTALLVSEIEDLDISEQIEPIVASVLGSGVVGAVPGVGTVAVNILTNSLIEGTANAFLTLRIGSVTRQYCGALTKLEKRLVRRSATVAAAGLLGSIVRESASVVSKAILNAVGEVGTRSAAAAKDGITSRLQKIVGRASPPGPLS
ncbi:MAG: DUF697 domain-containing protein, partial [Chloroflexi bacterium]|nr:DUF697 domain-containing protein [Chloroflexota bacterium]